jgi:nucleotide-binding universal stress UspA family protein
MNVPASILCPIDFSQSSAGALRYAAVIAAHLEARLVVLTVEDPLLIEAADLGAGTASTSDECRTDMEHFAVKTFGPESPLLEVLDYEVAVGKPGPEILRVARERSCDLIVLSTHGLTGMRKLFFGSTTERVLREATCPVLVTPPLDPGEVRLEDARRLVGRILAPVDLSPASVTQMRVARGLADALNVPLVLVHVVEPLKSRLAARLHLTGVEADRRAVAEDGLADLVAALPEGHRPEALVAYGDTAEELTKVARDRQVGLIVMGLHGSALLGPRMGSVTYRVLCLSHTLVLALPPAAIDMSNERAAVELVGAHRSS